MQQMILSIDRNTRCSKLLLLHGMFNEAIDMILSNSIMIYYSVNPHLFGYVVTTHIVGGKKTTLIKI